MVNDLPKRATALGPQRVFYIGKNTPTRPIPFAVFCVCSDFFGGLDMATLPGTAGDDTLVGTADADFISGGDGNDRLDGGAGSDTVDGGEGADRLIWSSDRNPGDHDVYHGGDGHTPIFDGGGYVTGMTGSEGYTFDLYSQNGGDSLSLNLGSDTGVTLIYDTSEAGEVDADGRSLSFDGVERVYLGEGNDSVDASGAAMIYEDAPNHFVGVRVHSGAGQDTIIGSSGSDYLHGDAGNDLIHGGDGGDLIEGGAGDDTVFGDGGNDGIRWGEIGSDFGVGNDVYHGGSGYNSLNAWQSDTSNSGVHMVLSTSDSGTVDATGAATGHLAFDGFQNLLTGHGDDTVDGSAAGVDGFRLYAAWGNDSIIGSNGSDTIEGGWGADTIEGGQGDDIISMTGDFYNVQGTAWLDAESDRLVLEDGFGRDTVVAFSFGDRNDGNGDLAAADQLDVTNLHGLNGAPLHVGDVVVRGDLDQWGNDFAVIQFPNGEELWLPGVDPADLTPERLHAMGIPCFCEGTLIGTDRGEIPVEQLKVGDLVVTRDHGLQSVRWIGGRALDAIDLALAPNLQPIRIRAGALGRGLPSADLMVSPQHRVLVRSAIAQRMFGAPEVLVAAKQLLAIDGIEQVEVEAVTYFHILFDRHEIVLSNGAETESLYTGAEAMKSLGEAARQEILTLFPELQAGPAEAVRPLIPGGPARQLAQRHLRNGKALNG